MRAVGEAFDRFSVQELPDTIPKFRALVRVYAVGIRTIHQRVDSELALTPYSIAPAHVSTGPLIESEAGSLPEGTGGAVDAARFRDACLCCSIGRHGSGEQRGLIGDLGRAT
ncbi:hypothetical protein AB0H00_31620 [Nocardia sp. NPDC023852]|uniref:hypothetical protein n=1 Tax=Nocardia sp. NPDC023852 TaxID=3154697 RepID=UPI0033DAA178